MYNGYKFFVKNSVWIFTLPSFSFLNTEIPHTSDTKYSITNLYNDGEQLLVETLIEIISDPFNKIKGSQHGPKIVSSAECMLQNIEDYVMWKCFTSY